MTGGLRRKRGGADLDLSDSDYDEDERRRVKRMKEAKLRQALMADENVEKIGTATVPAAMLSDEFRLTVLQLRIRRSRHSSGPSKIATGTLMTNSISLTTVQRPYRTRRAMLA